MGPDFSWIGKSLKANERALIYLLCAGVALMSIGVYLVGSHVPYGNLLLTVASAVTYASIIILVLII